MTSHYFQNNVISATIHVYYTCPWQLAFMGLVYPCLILAYMGEAAYLTKNKTDLRRSFYKAIPENYILASVCHCYTCDNCGESSNNFSTFSIISQCRALSCFPRVKIIHNSTGINGQIYIPEVNWILMFLCLAVVLKFRDTNMIGNAYGLAVITVMFVTTCLMFLIITTVWKRHILSALLFIVIFGSAELLYFSSCLSKVHRGGWLPLLVSFVILLLMSVWHYGTLKKQEFELQNKVCLDRLLSLGPTLGIARIPGIGLFYTDVTSGLPPMFAHFVANFPAFHRIMIFVTFQSWMVPKVPDQDRFLVDRIGPPEFCMFRCFVRYGYRQVKDCYDFETQLIMKILDFLNEHQVRRPSYIEPSVQVIHPETTRNEDYESGYGRRRRPLVSNFPIKGRRGTRTYGGQGSWCDLHDGQVVSRDPSSFLKKISIDFIYGFLRQNCRQPATDLGIPHASLVEVGMVYLV